MMKAFLLAATICVACLQLNAHPGIGIVKDKRGNIFYTDLEKVWKIDPNGKRTVVVSRVHTHELMIDSLNNLYGEHLWYNGEALNTWGHFVWQYAADGHFRKLKDSVAGILENYGFLQDAAGNMYWLERWKPTRFKKKAPDGTVTTVAEGDFKDLLWQYVSPGGDIFFVDKNKLIQIKSGSSVAHAIANDISADQSVMGIWSDAEGNIYFADYKANAVKQLDKTGTIRTAFSTTGGWSPSGGVVDNNGDLWILEYSASNEVRVEKVSKSALFSKATKTAETPIWQPAIFGLVAILLIIIIYFRRNLSRIFFRFSFHSTSL